MTTQLINVFSSALRPLTIMETLTITIGAFFSAVRGFGHKILPGVVSLNVIPTNMLIT